MIYKAENEKLVIQVNSLGAELCSVVDKESGREYMWSGDPAYWSGISPVLFPFIGCLKNGGYRYEGKEYEIGKHGFARRMEFTCSGQEQDALWFTLMDTEETQKSYPFAFCLEAGYVLREKTIQVKWRVTNRDEKEMYFALGGHPAFVCPPAYQEGNRTECSILFEGKERIESERIGTDGLIIEGHNTYELEQGILPVTTGIFDGDALVLDNSQVKKISLCDKDKQPYVSVIFDTPYVGVWSKPQDDATYICIEPWYGRCDSSNFEGELSERPWGRKLSQGACFEAGYEICIEK
ncbi:MAG: aldose 1-epimerase family protein [Clostridiales bacterium]|nr:aldose 1-epimerase family protein [Clostridiales bacterium]